MRSTWYLGAGEFGAGLSVTARVALVAHTRRAAVLLPLLTMLEIRGKSLVKTYIAHKCNHMKKRHTHTSNTLKVDIDILHL